MAELAFVGSNQKLVVRKGMMEDWNGGMMDDWMNPTFQYSILPLFISDLRFSF